MALAPQNEDAFLREVDEEVRREQLKTAWQRYGKLIVAAVVVALLALAGFLYWQHHRREQAGETGERFTQALADLGSNEAKAKPVLTELAGGSNEGYSAAARLTLAAVALSKGDSKGAAAQYKAVAEDSGASQPFRDLALIRQTSVEFDTLPPQQVIDRLKPLATAGSPWFGSAGELVGLAYMKLGKREIAGPLFAAMAKDKSVPETIRARALRLAATNGVDAVIEPRAGAAAAVRGE